MTSTSSSSSSSMLPQYMGLSSDLSQLRNEVIQYCVDAAKPTTPVDEHSLAGFLASRRDSLDDKVEQIRARAAELFASSPNPEAQRFYLEVVGTVTSTLKVHPLCLRRAPIGRERRTIATYEINRSAERAQLGDVRDFLSRRTWRALPSSSRTPFMVGMLNEYWNPKQSKRP